MNIKSPTSRENREKWGTRVFYQRCTFLIPPMSAYSVCTESISGPCEGAWAAGA